MSDKGWKQFERRLARDVGTERIPVTGERHGADCATGLFAFQFKLRKCLPGYLWEWLAGIVASAERSGKVGVLVVKKPRQRDAEALVVLRWADWVDLHGGLAAVCPSPDSPCFCDCHRSGRECADCLCGRHKPQPPGLPTTEDAVKEPSTGSGRTGA